MKCSAWEKWEEVDGKIIPTLICQNEATALLTNPGRWKDVPLCDNCAFWMMSAANMFNLPIKVKEIK